MNVKRLMVGVMAVALLAVGACSQKGPATAAIAAAENALAPIRNSAAKYVPEELKSVESALAALKDSAAKGDYKAVVANAPAVTTSIDTLNTHVAGKIVQAQNATAQWSRYATAVPNLVQALQNRVDTLSGGKNLPKGMDKAAFAAVKAGLESLKAEWATAAAAFQGGNALDAVEQARAAKAKGEELLQQLGMKNG